jgi:hypothetical protein
MKTVDFLYPSSWVASRNPLAVGLNPQTRDWALEMGLLLPQDSALKAMHDAFNTEEFAAWLYPFTRNVDFLRFVSDFTLWNAVLDDELEKTSPPMGAQARAELIHGWKLMIEGQHASGQSRYSAAFRDLTSRVQGFAGEQHGPQFAARFISLLGQMLATVAGDEPQGSLSWQDRSFYEAVRPMASQIPWYVLFVEIAEGCYLPEALTTDPRVQRLAVSAALIFGLMNDVFSVSKEETGRPVLNTVLMHMHRERCSQAEAIAAIAVWHNDLVVEHMQVARAAAGSFGAFDRHFERFVRGLQNFTRGLVEWMLNSRRYTLPTSCEVRIVSELG